MTFHQPKNRVWRDGPPILSLPFFKGEIYHPGRRGAGLHANMLLAQVANFYKTFAHGEFIKSIIKLIMCHHQTCNSPDQTKPYGFSQWSTKFLLTTIQDPTMINTVQIHIYIYRYTIYYILYIHTYFSKQPLLITCRCFASEISTTPTTNHLVADDSAGKKPSTSQPAIRRNLDSKPLRCQHATIGFTGPVVWWFQVFQDYLFSVNSLAYSEKK